MRQKIESLPEDLRSVANSLLTDKFKDQEILDRQYGVAQYTVPQTTNDHRVNQLTFEYLQNIVDSFKDLGGKMSISPDEVLSHSYRVTDIFSEQRQEELKHIPSNYMVSMNIEFWPVGTFDNIFGKDQRQFYGELRSQAECITVSGGEMGHAEMRRRVEGQLRKLKYIYRGDFSFRIVSMEVKYTEEYGGYL